MPMHQTIDPQTADLLIDTLNCNTWVSNSRHHTRVSNNRDRQIRIWAKKIRVEGGAWASARTSRGRPVMLETARRVGLFQEVGTVIRALLEAGADPNGSDTDDGCGETPLYVVAGHYYFFHHSHRGSQFGKRQAEVMETLLAFGANPDVRVGKEGKTALHLASSTFAIPCIAALLAAGADPNARCVAGRTPIQDVEEYNWACHGLSKQLGWETLRQTVTILLRWGANPAIEQQGETRSKRRKVNCWRLVAVDMEAVVESCVDRLKKEADAIRCVVSIVLRGIASEWLSDIVVACCMRKHQADLPQSEIIAGRAKTSMEVTTSGNAHSSTTHIPARFETEVTY